MAVQEKIDAIVSTDPYFNVKFATRVLQRAQEKANNSKGKVYLCYDIGCVYYVYEHEHSSMNDVITFVEPEVIDCSAEGSTLKPE